jgi:hypothetical protein
MNEISQIVNNVFIPYLLSSHPDQHSRKSFPTIDLIVFDRSPKVREELTGEAINVVRVMVQLIDSHQVDILCNGKGEKVNYRSIFVAT